MNLLLKSFYLTIITALCLFISDSTFAMNKIEFFKKHEENKLLNEKNKYCLNLFRDYYDTHDLLSQSALKKLTQLSIEDLKKICADLSEDSEDSEDSYNNLIEYVKHYYNKTKKKIIGLKRDEKELHEKMMNLFLPAFKKLESENEIKDDLESAVLQYNYTTNTKEDNYTTNTKNKDVTETIITTKKPPVSPPINIPVKNKNDYSPGKENYSPSIKKEEKNIPVKDVQLCDISFKNKEVKKTFVNTEQNDKIEPYKNDINPEIKGSINIVREKSDLDQEEKIPCNPFVNKSNPFLNKNLVMKKLVTDYKKTLDSKWSPFGDHE